MTRYVALLKGVNVGRSKRIAMSDLRAALTGLGYADVATYLASGNALFTTSSGRPAALLAADMEERITAELRMVVRVIVRTAGELAAVMARNPLAAEPENPSRFFVGFLSATPDPSSRPFPRARAASERSGRGRDPVDRRRGVPLAPWGLLTARPRLRDRETARRGGDDAHVEHGHQAGAVSRRLRHSPRELARARRSTEREVGKRGAVGVSWRVIARMTERAALWLPPQGDWGSCTRYQSRQGRSRRIGSFDPGAPVLHRSEGVILK